MTEAADLPTIEEKYTSATHTSNLRVVADKGGSADVLIAAGWSASRLGAALLRLHSEYDGAAKPRKPTPEAIEAISRTLDKECGKTGAIRRAAQIANAWHLHELGLLMGQLKTLPAVRAAVAEHATMWGMAGDVLSPMILLYWLDQQCPQCNGRKFKLVPGSPALSAKLCPVCRGAGVAYIPHGQDGKRLLNFLDDCVVRAQQSIKKRLYGMRSA